MTELEDKRMVTLISRDEQKYVLPMRAAILSILVKDALSQDDDDEKDVHDDKTEYKVDVLRVSGSTLDKVVEFMNHHVKDPMKEIPMSLDGGSFDEIVQQEWYANFVSDEKLGEKQELLFELLAAAKYMNIKPLLDLACVKVTFQLTSKSTEEIRTILNLKDLSKEEEDRARLEHPWVFEE